MPLLGIALAWQILSLLLFLSPMLPPLAPSPLLRPYPFPLPLLRNSFLFLDALSFLLLRALLAFALICNELLWWFDHTGSFDIEVLNFYIDIGGGKLPYGTKKMTRLVFKLTASVQGCYRLSLRTKKLWYRSFFDIEAACFDIWCQNLRASVSKCMFFNKNKTLIFILWARVT